MNRIILILVTWAGVGAWAEEVIAPKAVKAILTVPFTGSISAMGAWVDILACKPEATTCDIPLARISIKDVKFGGEPKVAISPFNELSVKVVASQALGHTQEVILSKHKIKNQWFDPAELCQSTGLPQTCRYVIERDPEHQTWSLKVYAN